ncbi:MAG: sugar phosphate nucleotidyltransferase [Chloroflexi bacterium]|nr:sugar phosphate nucleotidyltransferase [Chloroflexota bacterium]
MPQKVRKAVIPAAGLGTRFLPVTRAVPKPLLPVLDRPLIHYAVAEAAAAGIDQIAMVLSPGDDAIADYFRPNVRLERAFGERGDAVRLAQQKEINGLAEITVLEQTVARGLGHAVLMARDFVGDEPFAVFLPDDLIWSVTPAIAQLARISEEHGGSVVAAKRVPQEAIPNLGIIDAESVGHGVHRVRGLVEKPPLEKAPSDLAIIGRYILTPGVFDRIEYGSAGALGEIQLTDAIAAAIGVEPVHACEFEGDHIDAGTPAGMLAATIYEARRRPEFSDAVAALGLTRA